MDHRIRVALADDHPIIRLGVEATLDDIPSVQHIGSVADSTQLIALLDTQPCDVLVCDYAMPGGEHGDGLELIDFLHQRYPHLRVILLTSLDKAALIHNVLARGVSAILSKTDGIAYLRAAIQTVCAGRHYFSPSIGRTMKLSPAVTGVTRLSPRESEVIALYLRGASINAIAEKLQRSKQTVSTQKINAMRKLGLKTDADLFKHAIELGLVRDGGNDLA